VLDLLVLKKDDDGSLEAFELSDLDEGEIGELRTYESELAMLLSEEDVNSLAAAIEPLAARRMGRSGAKCHAEHEVRIAQVRSRFRARRGNRRHDWPCWLTYRELPYWAGVGGSSWGEPVECDAVAPRHGARRQSDCFSWRAKAMSLGIELGVRLVEMDRLQASRARRHEALEFLVEGPAGKRRLIRFVAIDLILAPGPVFVRVAACEC
jgi:hypothetical protein